MPRKQLAISLKFEVVYEPDGMGWHVHIPEVPGCRSHGRSIAEARRNIREALSTCVDTFDNPDAVARSAELEEDIRLPRAAQRVLDRAQQERRIADACVTAAQAAAAVAAKVLTDDVGLSLRDAGELLGLSHERVKQIRQQAPGKRDRDADQKVILAEPAREPLVATPRTARRRKPAPRQTKKPVLARSER
jgi:predicted RNase H-like HicB family nuclease